MPKAKFNKASRRMTPLQLMEVLFIDCYMAERSVRNAWLTEHLGRTVRFLVDLTEAEVAEVITVLKRMKAKNEIPFDLER